MKRLIFFVLSLTVMFSCLSFLSFAENETSLSVNAKSGVLMDADTKEVLYAFNENEKLYPASVTKIMPLLLFMEALDSKKISLDDTVTASPVAASKGGSQIWLREGEQMTVDELIKAAAIASANDACTALGEHLAGSEDAFVKLMNDRAKELGMKNTNFENCSGLDDDTSDHLTTAYDIALMSAELLKHEKIKDYTTVWMDSLRNGSTQLVNTNKLVRFYEGTTGLKTGTTTKAGHCLSASAERDGLHLVAVVMGADNSTDRFEGAKEMLNFGFSEYVRFTPKFDMEQITDVKVIKGIDEYVKVKIPDINSITLKRGNGKNVESHIELSADVEAPVEENQTLGKLVFEISGETVAEYSLIAEKSVEKVNIGVIMLRFLKSITKAL